MSASSNAPRSPLSEAWRRYRKDKLAVLCLGIFTLFALTALAAQLVELYELFFTDDHLYSQTLKQAVDTSYDEKATPPSAGHPLAWLGTTSAGKSVLLRVFHGTKIAFVVGLCGALVAATIGTTLGLVAGFFGKWVDEAVVYIYSTLASIPGLLLLLAVAFIVRQGPIGSFYSQLSIGSYAIEDFVSLGLFNIIFVIGATSWIGLCRLVRAETKKVRELEYIQAARAMGFGNTRILFKHILPNVFHLVIINFSLTFVIAIKSEVILTFLGVGVDQEPSWGRMIAGAKSELMQGIWWPLLASGLALFMLTLAVNYVGDALRDALDPRLKT